MSNSIGARFPKETNIMDSGFVCMSGPIILPLQESFGHDHQFQLHLIKADSSETIKFLTTCAIGYYLFQAQSNSFSKSTSVQNKLCSQVYIYRVHFNQIWKELDSV